jgi:hypothetical protein
MTNLHAGFRGLALGVLLALSASATARAESVLFLSSDTRAAELFAALELELRGYGPMVLFHGAPQGESEGAHLASARSLTLDASAAVSVWVEHAPPARVRALALHPEQLADAPLPAPLDSIEPRVFASIAASLALEALHAQHTALAARAQEPLALEPAAPPSAAPLERTPSALRRPRFFARAAFSYGVASVGKGHKADQNPSVALVTAASLQGERASSFLFASGYDCDLHTTGGNLLVSNCDVAVNQRGPVVTAAFDFAAGYRVWRELGVALTARFNPNAGVSPMAQLLVGTELSWLLHAPAPTGFFADLSAGFGLGQIQVRPATSSPRKPPFVSSGLFNLRAGLVVGYMFWPRFGLLAGVTLHAMFPETLWAFDPKLGLELRL